LLVANQEIFCVVSGRFGGDGLERDFEADTGGVANEMPIQFFIVPPEPAIFQK